LSYAPTDALLAPDLLRLAMHALHTTSWAVLHQLEAIRVIALVLTRRVRALLALRARELQRGSVLCFCHLLLGDLRDRAGANGAAAFANREALTDLDGDRGDELNRHLDVVARHDHLGARWEAD